MREKILALEKIAASLEPSNSERKHFQNLTNDYSNRFLNQIDSCKAFEETEEKGIGIYDFPISEKPKNFETLLNVIEKEVDFPGLNPASGGHLAYIPGGGIFPSALGDYLADVTNNFAGMFFAAPGAVRMENQLIRWMCDIMGFDNEKAGGNLTSGGSIANLTAIVTARDASKIEAKDFHKSVIYATKQTHHSIQKAIRIAGLKEAILRYVEMDEGFRINAKKLEKQIQEDKNAGLLPIIVIASAGTTDVGAVDPIDKIANICSSENVWLHVDGAYGGFFILCDEVKSKFKGIEKADSITIDPHKGLFLPYGTGAVLIKNRSHLYHSHYYKASYLRDVETSAEEFSPADLSPELTKHFRGLRMWLPLQLFGLKPFKAALSEKIYLARYFYERIKEMPNFEVGSFPELSVTYFRYVPENENANDFNNKLVEAIRIDGRIFLSSTTIDEKVYIRLAVLCFRSHLKTIDLALEVIKDLIEKLK